MPGGSEQGYVDGLVARFGSNGACASEAFDPLKRGKGGTQVGERTGRSFAAQGSRLDRLSFCIVHFAEPVRYSAEGWLAKNVSGLHPDLAFVLTQSESPLVRGMYPSSTADATAKRPSVGAAFRKSLRSLSTVMLQTTQSFLRCVKPNGAQRADAGFSAALVRQQLRCAGTVEAVQLMATGYPTRIPYSSLYERYAPQLPQLARIRIRGHEYPLEPRLFCETLARALGVQSGRYKLGATRLFLRAGSAAGPKRPPSCLRTAPQPPQWTT